MTPALPASAPERASGSTSSTPAFAAHRSLLTVCLAWLLGVLAACSASSAQSGSDPVAADSPPTTAIVVAAVDAPLRVAGSDGLVHLSYDLIVTNAFTAPVTLSSLAVLGENGEALLTLSGTELAQRVEAVLGTTPLSNTDAIVPVSGSVAVVVDVPVPPGAVPARVSHRIKYAVPPNAPSISIIGSYDIEGPVLEVSRLESLLIKPPMRGSGWLSLNGCCDPNAHRSLRTAIGGTKLVKGETYAIDYVLLRGSAFFAGDGSSNAQHYAYGAELLAVADGEVVFVRADMPDEAPFLPVQNVRRPVDYAGNQVVVRIGPNRWALYGHMQPGSARVRVGDRVRTGQVLGLLGNSGNTTLPHLHFEILDNPVNTSANSVPYVFDDYTLEGTISPSAIQAPPGPAGFPIYRTSSRQRQTHPLWLTISGF